MPFINEIGNRYGKLVVIERAANDSAGRAHWVCKCDCGNITTVRGTTLRSGATKSCGCLQREKASQNGNNLVGQKFGRLTVIKQSTNNNTHRGKYWICKCDCGNISSVRGDQLTSGSTQSCGCLQREKAGANKINEIGNTYGYLTVIGEAPSDLEGHARWLCQCKCGNKKVCYGERLRKGVNLSCGCMTSKGEAELVRILTDNNINFLQQYSFNDLKSVKNTKLRFDFAIFKQTELFCLIEYQGIQHFDLTNFYYSDILILNDNLKREYCKQHNIKLFELTIDDNLLDFVKTLKKEIRT